MKVKRPMAPVEIPLEPRSVHDEFSIFKPPEGEPKIRTSPQLLLATHRFLSRGLPALMWNDKLQEAVCYSDFTMVKGTGFPQSWKNQGVFVNYFVISRSRRINS